MFELINNIWFAIKYSEKCDCRGDQYGSCGPCELCKELAEIMKEIKEG